MANLKWTGKYTDQRAGKFRVLWSSGAGWTLQHNGKRVSRHDTPGGAKRGAAKLNRKPAPKSKAIDLGPSNDAPAAVQVEILAAEVGQSAEVWRRFIDYDPEIDADIGRIGSRGTLSLGSASPDARHAHLDPPPRWTSGETRDYWAGWLACEIATNKDRYARDAWPWDHTRPVAGQWEEWEDVAAGPTRHDNPSTVSIDSGEDGPAAVQINGVDSQGVAPMYTLAEAEALADDLERGACAARQAILDGYDGPAVVVALEVIAVDDLDAAEASAFNASEMKRCADDAIIAEQTRHDIAASVARHADLPGRVPHAEDQLPLPGVDAAPSVPEGWTADLDTLERAGTAAAYEAARAAEPDCRDEDDEPPITIARVDLGHCEACSRPVRAGQEVRQYVDDEDDVVVHAVCPIEDGDSIPRPAGCECNQEEGDSPCPVHGEEEPTTPADDALIAEIASAPPREPHWPSPEDDRILSEAAARSDAISDGGS